MPQISAVDRANPAKNIDINCDAQGNLFVNSSPTNSVKQGDLYLDGSVLPPLIPSSGPLLFAVDPTDTIQPLHVNPVSDLFVDTRLVSEDGDLFLDENNPDPTNGVVVYGVNPSNKIKPLSLDSSNILNVNLVSDNTAPPLPPPGTPNRSTLYAKYLTQAGGSLDPEQMTLDGSVTPISHYAGPEVDGDLYITSIQLLLQDNAINLSKFGNLSALTNGLHIHFIINNETAHLIHAAKSSGDLLAQAAPTHTFGTQGNVSIIPNFVGNTDAQIISIDISAFHPLGIRIGRGNVNDRVEVMNYDDLTALDGFTVRAIGYKVVN